MTRRERFAGGPTPGSPAAETEGARTSCRRAPTGGSSSRIRDPEGTVDFGGGARRPPSPLLRRDIRAVLGEHAAAPVGEPDDNAAALIVFERLSIEDAASRPVAADDD